MSHGIYALDPDAANLSQLSVVVQPGMRTRVGGVMSGAGTVIASDGTLTLAPATAQVIGGVKQGPNNTIDADGMLHTLPGTVTSVALQMPADEFTVAGSPISSAGTLTVTKNAQPANQVIAGPASGAAAQPVFRKLVQADIPWLQWQAWSPAIIGSSGPYTPAWQIAQYRSDGVTVDVALVFTVNIVSNKRTNFWITWPVQPLTDGWPLCCVMLAEQSVCYAFIDVANGGICITLTYGNMPTGTQTFHVDGRYQVS